MKSSLIHHCTLTGLAFVTAAGSIGAQTLGFGLSVSPSTYSVLVSNSITYTIDVTNRTGLTVSDLWVTNSFSTPVTVESISFTVGNGVNYTGSAFTKSSEILLDFKQFTPTGFTTGIGQAIFTVIPNPASFRSNGFFTNAVVAIAPALQTVPNSAFTNVVIQVTNALFVADLGVVLTGFAQGILAGDILNYRATVTNHGRDKVSGVLLTNMLPVGTRLVSVTPSNEISSFINGVVVLNLGTLTNATSSSVALTVQPTNAGLQTFAVSVGAPGLIDPNPVNNFFSTNINVGNVITGQVIVTLPSPMVFDFQTGLMDQRIRLLNVSTSAVDAVRVTVSGITNWLYNAIGTNHGNPFVVYPNTLNPGESIDLILEFFVPTRIPIEIGESNYTAVAVPAFNLVSPTGTNGTFSITRTVLLSDGNLLIEFPSVLGASYSIIYSTNADLSDPLIAQPNVIAPADRVQWIDNGPPKTVSPPPSAISRFYRVLRN